jgi:enoyl-[acyl-carrier protein] reductase II
MLETNITRMLDVKHPIISAPMGPFYTTKLAVAVSEAGGLGVLSHVNLTGKNSIEELKKGMQYVVEHTDNNFGFNIRTAKLQPDSIKLCRQIPRFIMDNQKIKEQCRYIVTSAGSPEMLFNKNYEKLKESGSQIKHFHVVPNLDLARKCVNWGVDGLIITGNEGGGHQSYDNVSTLVLLQQVRKDLPDIPIIAAGGYVTGEGLASAISMGAGAIVMGSRFISSKECEFHENVKKAIVKSSASDTEVVSGIFGPMRVLKNQFTAEHKIISSKEENLLSQESVISEVVKEVNLLEKTYQGDINHGAVLLGQSIGIIDKIESVAEIIETIVSEAEKCLIEAYNTVKPIPLANLIAS